jgi:hypothetical protein
VHRAIRACIWINWLAPNSLVVSQREIPSLEDIIEEERGYFLRTDRDGDKKLSKAEFVQHFLDSMGEWPNFRLAAPCGEEAFDGLHSIVLRLTFKWMGHRGRCGAESCRCEAGCRVMISSNLPALVRPSVLTVPFRRGLFRREFFFRR